MKKIVSIIAITALAAGIFSGCGGGNSGNDGSGSDESGAVDAVNTAEVTVVSREDGSGTRGAFIELTGIEERDANGNRKDLTTKEAVIANRTDIMLTNVSSDPNAIGYVSLGSLNSSVKAVSINGVAPTAANIKNGAYVISRPFNIATKGEPEGLAGDFISFILSAAGQEIISNGYIAIDESAPPFDGEKPAGKLVIAGSSSVSPVMEKLAEAYMEINTDADIQIQTSDSTTGINSTIEGIADVGMASRDLKESELAELLGISIAVDGIAVIIHNSNSVENLDIETVKLLFTGEITTWEL